MKRSGLRFHPAAQAELLAAQAWYWERNEATGDAFFLEIERGLDEIAEHPQRWPLCGHGARKFILRRFPFSIVYIRRETAIEIVAVAHGKRRPEYWKRRWG